MREHKRSDDDDNRLGQSVQAGNKIRSWRGEEEEEDDRSNFQMYAYVCIHKACVKWILLMIRPTPTVPFSLLNVTCKWHHPLYNTLIFISFSSRPIINYWFSMIIDVNATGSILMCARFHTQLPIVYICSSLKSTTHYYSSSRERKWERERARTRGYTHARIYPMSIGTG